jgi:hypothetical protein
MRRSNHVGRVRSEVDLTRPDQSSSAELLQHIQMPMIQLQMSRPDTKILILFYPMKGG